MPIDMHESCFIQQEDFENFCNRYCALLCIRWWIVADKIFADNIEYLLFILRKLFCFLLIRRVKKRILPLKKETKNKDKWEVISICPFLLFTWHTFMMCKETDQTVINFNVMDSTEKCCVSQRKRVATASLNL